MTLRVNADDFQQFAAKAKHFDKALRAATRKRIREAALPFARAVVAEGSDGMPHSGGLADRIAASGRTPTITQNATGVRLVLGKRKGPQIGQFDEGKLRHPVFGVYHTTGSGVHVRSEPGLRWTWKWAEQAVPAGTFTKAAEQHLPDIRDAVVHEIETIMGELG